MKKTKILVSALAVTACISTGMMFGCAPAEEGGSSAAEDSSQSWDQLSDYEKIIQANSIESLLGDNGTLSCTIETYGEESALEDTEARQWTMTDGQLSVQSKDVFDDGETLYTMSGYSGDNCGAFYMSDEGETAVTIYPQNTFAEDLKEEWSTYIDYSGTQSEVVTEGNTSTLEVTYEPVDDEDSYYKAVYIFDPNTYILQSLEVTDFLVETDEVVDKIVLKDIAVGGTIQMEENPYQTITEASEDESCNLTIVVNQLDGQQITSTYKVLRSSMVDLGIVDEYDAYSDEAMTTLIDEEDIDVNAPSATIYVKINAEATDDAGIDADLTTADGDSVDIDSLGESIDAPGTEYTSPDGAVLTVGEDGNLYDEEGNVVTPDELTE